MREADAAPNPSMNTSAALQPSPESPSEVIVSVLGIGFGWRRDTPAVIEVDSLAIRRGERIFIEGPSGSGKSTLLSLLAGVVVPQSGQLTVLGKRIDQLRGAARDRFRSDHIGFIFQMFNLIPYLSVVENVTLPCRFSATRKAKAVARAGTVEAEAVRLLTHLDMTHGDLLRRSVTELSVGQQQRVAAARALMGAPEILIADEPTSSLDADRRAAFVRLLFEECADADTTLIFVSHDTSLESLFDRTIRLAEINRAPVSAGHAATG